MTVYISPNMGKQIVKLLIGCFVVMLLVVIYVFWAGYEGRKNIVEVQRAGCQRGKLDRAANARGWRTAQQRATSQGQHSFALTYRGIASELEVRSKINCREAFPDARFIP